jgi:hypothetical protein
MGVSSYFWMGRGLRGRKVAWMAQTLEKEETSPVGWKFFSVLFGGVKALQ